MSKIEIEKLIYKKPSLILGLGNLGNIHKLTGEDEDLPVESDDPEPSYDPYPNDGSMGTGHN